MRIEQLASQDLLPALNRFWAISANKISSLNQTYDATLGSPVFTVKGNYATRGWAEWTQGFQFGSEILQFDATGDEADYHAREVALLVTRLANDQPYLKFYI